MAEQTTTSTSETEAKVDTFDSIAELLLDTNEEDSTESEKEQLEVNELSESSTEEASDDAEEKPEETEEVQEATWSSTLGIDDSKIVLDEDGNFAGFNVKVDGKISTVPTADLIAGYQTAKSNTNKSQKLAEDRKELDNVINYTVQNYTKKLEDVDKLSKHLESSLVKDFQNINWDILRQNDPAEYAALVQDFQIRQAEIQNIHSAIAQERETALKEIEEQNAKARQEYLKTEVEKVIEKNPNWAKPEVFKKALTELKSFIDEEYGFTEADFANIQDARIFEVLKDAMAYKKGKRIAETKLAKPAPKFQKPGVSAKSKPVSKLEQLSKAAKAASPGQRKRDLEASAIAELLMGR